MFKELEIMKTLRYLLIAIVWVSILSASAEVLNPKVAQLPEYHMQSTSKMMSSGTTLPLAAQNGVVTTYNTTPSTYNPGGPRRVGEGEGFEDEDDPDAPGNPFPMGDALWPLMFLAAGYVLLRIYRRKQRV